MVPYKVGIVGYGYVGRGMHRLFKEWVAAVYSLDLPQNEILTFGDAKIGTTKEDFKDVDLAIICVPTPMGKDGRCDTSIVEDAVRWLSNINKEVLTIIKSTVAVGTTDRLAKKYSMKMAMSPEYLGEGNYFIPPWIYPDPTDPTSHGFMVIGGATDVSEAITQIFIRKMGPHTKFVFLTAREAEAVKYWENLWGAMKVIFANQMYDCLKALGVSFYKAREGWAADPRAERMHTAVFENARGFSGKCYPKDIRAFIYSVEKAGFNPKLIKMIWNLNSTYRPKEFKPIK